MPKIGRLHVDYTGTWNGYMDFHVVFDIVCEINDSITNMKCTVQNFSETHGSGGRQDGYGFVNYGAICWYMPEHLSEHLSIPPNEAGPESINDTWNQITGAMPSLSGNAIFGYGLNDNPNIATEKLFGGNYVHNFPLGGVLPTTMNLVNGMSRWYRWEGYPMSARRAIIQTTNSFAVDLSDINWRYIPWSIYKTGNFQSCNRSGGHFGIRKGSSYRKIENDEVFSSGDHAFIRKGNSWTKSPKTGLNS